ncbi:MAG: EcsC family protein [Ignavibacteriales bacterium]|nr:EcsC family protein [Ignavibacteriales bacterium]
MEKQDYERLRHAVDLLENPSWTAKVTDLIGIPIEWTIKQLPKRAKQIISNATTKAIRGALKAAIYTMKVKHKGAPHRWWHEAFVATSGAVGGFFGLLGLPFELPISTVAMLRSIAAIAQSEGEDLKNTESQLNCIEVFALGGKSEDDDGSESGYYAIRATLAKLVTEASEFIAEKGLAEESAPIIVRFIARIAARFEVVISEKVSTEIVPVIGAISGATINLLFINHFQSIAIGHFAVRSLERKYGEDIIRKEYEAIAKSI